ncbi:hypothetical protein [Pseudomonas sp. FME51]|nr:hypothetical protein [Pseudomonas sp. FME51]
MGKADSPFRGCDVVFGVSLWVGTSILIFIFASYWWLLIDNQRS